MSLETAGQFLQRLAEKSEKRAIPWEATSNTQAFVVGLSNLTVTVSRQYTRNYDSEEGSYFYDPYVHVEVRDKRGTLLDEADSDTSREGLLQGLYENARQVALNVRTQLDAALKELDSFDGKSKEGLTGPKT